jgi:hypothetical protein
MLHSLAIIILLCEEPGKMRTFRVRVKIKVYTGKLTSL